LTFVLVDENKLPVQQLKIGLLKKGNYDPAMLHTLKSADRDFAITWFQNEVEGRQWLKDKNGDGMLLPSDKEKEGSALIVLQITSFQTVAIVNTVSALQQSFENKSGNWISEIRFLQESAIHKQMWPTWILMLVLMVGFIVLPPQVAEEKEKKLLLGLLQTPIREVEWLLAKVSLGMILIAVAALLLHLLMAFDGGVGIRIGYVIFLLAGSFCFSSFGILVGFLCRTQASARVLGVLIYLPHLLPSALADFSQKLNSVAPLIPSFQFYKPIKSILLEGGSAADFSLQLLALFGFGMVSLFLSFMLMKKRWLM